MQVGLAIDVVSGRTTFDTFGVCFSATNKVEIPMAPGIGLYLDELYFDRCSNSLHASLPSALSLSLFVSSTFSLLKNLIYYTRL